MSPADTPAPQAAEHSIPEPHGGGLSGKLNWLRAGVLGANDGIVSTAGVLIGVAAAGGSDATVLTAGMAAVASGAASMALGEYVSVSAQRDTERALVAKESHELATMPEAEHEELVAMLQAKGLSAATARTAAAELARGDLLKTHLELELGIDGEDLSNPWVAAFASAVSFLLGAMLPWVAAMVAPDPWRVAVILLATLVTLGVTGTVAAMLGRAHRGRAIVRLVVGGGLALAVTYVVGVLFGLGSVA